MDPAGGSLPPPSRKILQNSVWRLPLGLLFFVTDKKTLCLAIESESTSLPCCAHWVEKLSVIHWKMTCCTLCSTDFHQAARNPDKHSPHQNQGRWYCVAHCCAAFIYYLDGEIYLTVRYVGFMWGEHSSWNFGKSWDFFPSGLTPPPWARRPENEKRG